MRQVFEHIRTVEDMAPLTEVAFKSFVADAFRDAGFVVEAPPEPRDYGADFIMTKASRKIVVRAKQYMGLVGLDVVRAVHFAKDLYATDEAWAVAAYGFTAQAVCAAESTGVRLVTGADILRLIEASAGGAPDPQQQMLPEMHDVRPT